MSINETHGQLWLSIFQTSINLKVTFECHSFWVLIFLISLRFAWMVGGFGHFGIVVTGTYQLHFHCLYVWFGLIYLVKIRPSRDICHWLEKNFLWRYRSWVLKIYHFVSDIVEIQTTSMHCGGKSVFDQILRKVCVWTNGARSADRWQCGHAWSVH